MYFIAESYFEYPTASFITFDRKEFLYPPKLFVCFESNDWTTKAWNLNDSSDPSSAARLNSVYPSTNAVIVEANNLVTEKFVTKNSVCYAFDPSQQKSNFLSMPDFIYNMKLNHSVLPKKFTATMLLLPHGQEGHFNDEFPIVYSYKRNLKSTIVHLFYRTYHQEVLKTPFASDCQEYSSSQSSCINVCMKELMGSRFNVTPFQFPVSTNDTKKRIAIFGGFPGTSESNSFNTIEDPELIFRYRNINKTCHKSCRRMECNKDYFILMPPEVKDASGCDDSILEIRLNHPKNVQISIFLIPTQPAYAFVIFILCCPAFWFGFAVFSFLERLDKMAMRSSSNVTKMTSSFRKIHRPLDDTELAAKIMKYEAKFKGIVKMEKLFSLKLDCPLFLVARDSGFPCLSMSTTTNRSWKRLSKLANVAFCTMCCVLHVFFICLQYFEYDTQMSVTMSRPNTIKPPIASLCFEASKLRRPDLSMISNMENVPVFQLLDESIGSFEVFDLPSRAFEEGYTLKLKTFFKDSQICFSHEDIGYPAFSRRMMSLLLPVNYIQDIKVASYLLDRVDTPINIYLSHASKLPYGTGHPLSLARSKTINFTYTFPSNDAFLANQSINVTSRYPNSPIVTHTKIISQILPPPFKSQCRTYSHSGYESQDECFNDCVLRKSINYTNRVLDDMLITGAFAQKKLLFRHHHPNLDNDFDKWTQKCESLCSQTDCTRVDFFPRLSGWRTKDLSYFCVYLVVPGEPDIESIMVPAVTLIDVITFISGCVSFWFGLAFYTSLSALLPVTVITEKLRRVNQRLLFTVKGEDADSFHFKEFVLKQKLMRWFLQNVTRYEARREIMEQLILIGFEKELERHALQSQHRRRHTVRV